jgi:predicted RNA binding protein YcfA (HicA-like mRNA interferase family)
MTLDYYIIASMSGKSKRRQKIAQNPKSVRFEDLRLLLEDYGFSLARSKGSHHSFVGYIGNEKTSITIPFQRPLKEIYVRQVLSLLDEIDKLDNDKT